VVKLSINTKKHSLRVRPVLKMVDESLTLDPPTDSIVKKWTGIADKSYAAIGFDAKKVVMQTGEPLDGRETEIRRRSTNLTKLVVAAMQKASPTSDVVIINSGSIRVDDIIQMPMTQYDVIRSLPFGGGMTEVDMKGSLLTQIVEAGRKNTGIGGYLHYSPELIYNEQIKNWTLKGIPVDPAKTYKVALTDFLLTGGEANMDFLKKDNPGISKVYPAPSAITDPRSDIRLAIIRYIENQ
jgi:2',3'-cyclic-nucleotide 2'-phosphodiesterase (5'-nucleotidase family)